jgi:hypothetical protein
MVPAQPGKELFRCVLPRFSVHLWREARSLARAYARRLGLPGQAPLLLCPRWERGAGTGPSCPHLNPLA